MIERKSKAGWIEVDNEERGQPRRHLVTYPEVIDAISGESLGRVVDLSPDGFRLVARKADSPGSRPHLRMILPGNPQGYDEIEFGADPVWSGPDINPEFRDTGYRLTAISGPNRHKLTWLLRRSAMRA